MLITHHPFGPLSALVDSIWIATRPALAHDRELSPPTGCVDIVIPLLQDGVVRFDGLNSAAPIHLRGGVVSGAHDRYAVRGMAGPSSVIGVHFRPGGAAAFFGGCLAELRNRTVLLDAVWGPAANELRERLQVAQQGPAERIRIVERALLARLRADRPADPIVTGALRAFQREPAAARIETVQCAFSCSAESFIRRFEAAVGMTPKRYARVLRFNATLGRIARPGVRDWARIAADGGYFDQSHLIHEFRRLAGMTPASYAPLRPDQPTHVPIGPASANENGARAEKSPIRRPATPARSADRLQEPPK